MNFTSLPPELLIRVFSLLDHSEREYVAGVCKMFHSIMNDDGGWRSAFVAYFGDISIMRANVSSWKDEYLTRLKVKNDWQSSIQAVTFDPRISNIEIVDINKHGFLVVGSLETGIITSCNPATGKASISTIYASQDSEAMQIGAMDMNCSKIVIGCLSGSVLYTDYNLTRWTTFKEYHNGFITSIKLIPNTYQFLSTGVDYEVRLWNASTEMCIGRFDIGKQSKASCLSCDLDYVYAGLESGNVIIWKITETSKLEKQSPFSMWKIDNPIKSLIWLPSMDSHIVVSENGTQLYIAIFDKTGNISQIPQRLNLVSYLYIAKSNNSKLDYILTGGHTGELMIWSIDLNKSLQLVKSVTCHTGPIISISMTATLLATFSDFGEIVLSDTITFSKLRTIRTKRGLLGSINPRCLFMTPDFVALFINNSITTWTLRANKGPVKKGKSKKNRVSFKTPRSDGFNRATIHDQISDAINEVKTTQEVVERKKHLEKSINGTTGLCDDDLISYAMLLSMDQEGGPSTSQATHSKSEELSEQEMLDLALALSLSESN